MQLMGPHVWASGQADGIYVFDREKMERLHIHRGHESYINQSTPSGARVSATARATARPEE